MMSCAAAASRLTLRRCRHASSLSQLSTRSFHGSSFLSYTDDDPSFEGVSSDVSKVIYHHAHQPQTAVSLQALMRTGRGEFLHKTYKEAIVDKEDDGKVATEQVLIQVCSSFYFLLPVFSVGALDPWPCALEGGCPSRQASIRARKPGKYPLLLLYYDF